MSISKRSGRKRGPVVTERDADLFQSLYKYRFLSLAQVERLFFPSTQTANRRIRLLGAADLVAVFRPAGFPDRIVSLTRKGLETVAGKLEVPVEALGTSPARIRPKDYYFLRHFLAVAEFRINLTRACEKRLDITLLGFVADHVVERTDQGGFRRLTRDLACDIPRGGEKVGHTPDGVFALQRGKDAALFFFEADRGTESVSHPERGFAKTLRFYLSFLASGGYQRYRDIFGVPSFKTVRVLVATSSRARLDHIRAAGAALRFQPAGALGLIWLAETSAVTEETIFSSIWVSLDPTDAKTYRIAGASEPVPEGALIRD
jgi:hypothetical protein